MLSVTVDSNRYIKARSGTVASTRRNDSSRSARTTISTLMKKIPIPTNAGSIRIQGVSKMQTSEIINRGVVMIGMNMVSLWKKVKKKKIKRFGSMYGMRPECLKDDACLVMADA